MREDALRRFQSRRPQERRPVDAVEAHDVLADDVQVRRPVVPELPGLVGKADAGDVVGEGVDPHVHDVLLVAGNLDAPVEGGARDRQVLEPALDEAHDLVATLLRADELRMRLIVGEQPVLIGREAEEVALLLDPIDRGALGATADAILAQLGLGFSVVGLVANRVPAGIGRLVDVAVRLHPPPDLLGRAVVARLGGADEVVVGQAERRDHLLEQRRIAVGQLARRELLPGGRLAHLRAVLVGAGQEIDVAAVEPLEAGDRVRGQRLVGVADVRRTVRVGNGGGEVVLRRWHELSPLGGFRENWNERRRPGRRSPSGMGVTFELRGQGP